MIEYLQTMVDAAERIAAGDLTAEITPRSDRDALGHAFETMINNLRVMLGRLHQTAGSLDLTSAHMATSSEETGRATAEISQAIDDVADGAERQAAMIETVRTAAGEVTSEAVSDAIRALAAKFGQIGEIVATITAIAEQTNLLALNAAIEAARAGEQGRGFAVVAEEVRKLAEESQTAAKEITQLIGAIQAETHNAVRVVDDGARKTLDGTTIVERTRDAFLAIGEAVEDMVGRIDRTAGAAQQVSTAASRMQESIGQVAMVAEESSASTQEVSAATQQTSATTQEVAASAHELSSNAAELNRLVSEFRLPADPAT